MFVSQYSATMKHEQMQRWQQQQEQILKQEQRQTRASSEAWRTMMLCRRVVLWCGDNVLTCLGVVWYCLHCCLLHCFFENRWLSPLRRSLYLLRLYDLCPTSDRDHGGE